ncbi:hypothetical protein OG239_00435 [Streptomyces sp. NBC_00868]|uniref:hypothetical protein n=1 Tax=unclassified Streptomyces TaxID=2593676 RepID=UPI0032557697|nr:hypothetical protein OG239_00435 [Streptomyces sp. NBC_00868]
MSSNEEQLFATCAQVAVALLIVVGVDLAVLRAIGLRFWSAMGGAGQDMLLGMFDGFGMHPDAAAIQTRKPFRKFLKAILAFALLAIAVGMPAVTGAVSIWALWNNDDSTMALVSVLAIISLVAVAMLMFWQFLTVRRSVISAGDAER